MDALGKQWGLRFDGCGLGLTARRICEHVELGQINPFPPISPASPLEPQAYVDIAHCVDPVQTLTGHTLADLLAGRHAGIDQPVAQELLRHAQSAAARRWLRNVGDQLQKFSQRRAVRNMPESFLPKDGVGTLGVVGLRCSLLEWLKGRGAETAPAAQWCRRIANLTGKGLKDEEVTFSGLLTRLNEITGPALTGDAFAKLLSYDDLRLSVLPVIRPAGTQLEFAKVPANTDIKRIKPKLKTGLVTHPQLRDRILGYWIDAVKWSDLLGPQQGWMAFTHRGQPVVSPHKHTGLCATPAEAQALASSHAAGVFPKLTAQGQWSEFRLTGGEGYREWLVTLPYYRPSFFSSHFEHRNVLLHVRCDVREDANGGRALVLQEVQSDWAQRARRALKSGLDQNSIAVPPWLQEWPALALKLMLLHAAQRGASALAWTTGRIQVERYRGLGKAGLLELYDRTLPAELTRLLRPYGRKCESLDVFQPQNFYIEPAEIGYEIFDEDQQLVGEAETWEEAQAMLPDGAHEVLRPMHGIRLDAEMREKILATGFYAWGGRIH